MNTRFKNRVAVVTGAASGIGRATATRFAAEGASVVLVDLPGQALHEVAAAITQAGGKALAVEADVTERAGIERYVAAAQKEFGGIDCFFNNAGILGALAPLLQYPEDVFDRVMAVNVKAVWLGMKLVAPLMLARGGGAIVNTASVAGLRGAPNLSAYATSKHAVIGMTRSVAIELATQGVRVNAVCPSPIETPMATLLDQGVSGTQLGAVRARMLSRIPMARYGTPEEVAALVCFLCSADASYISGAAYAIDGASTA